MREEVLERLEAVRADPEGAPPAAAFRFKALEARPAPTRTEHHLRAAICSQDLGPPVNITFS